MKLAALALAVAACGPPDFQYNWDERQTLCSAVLDDIGKPSPWDRITEQLEIARANRAVALIHAHVPDETVRESSIEYLFDLIEDYELDYVTYAELDPSQPHRGAVALAFDDQAVDQWFAIRDVFTARGARVTFFLTRVGGYDDAMLEKVAALAADGHGIEAHSVDHLASDEFLVDHTIEEYVEVEVMPSIRILEDKGFPVHAYAYPFGRASSELDAAVRTHVRHTRVSAGSCPY